MRKNLLVIFSLVFLSSIAHASKPQPYAGQEQRGIKALSAAEIEGLLAGKGMGMAKPAELNHYPGPLHVMEVMNELDLSETQQLQTRQLYTEMKREAVGLGQQIVAAERRLDREFSSGDMTAEKLQQQLASIATLRGQLRYVHLKTHLKQKALMTTEQVRRYDHLRGYLNHSGHHEH